MARHAGPGLPILPAHAGDAEAVAATAVASIPLPRPVAIEAPTRDVAVAAATPGPSPAIATTLETLAVRLAPGNAGPIPGDFSRDMGGIGMVGRGDADPGGPDGRAACPPAAERAGRRSIDEGEWGELLRDLAARLGLSRRVTLLAGPLAPMPMTWGWLRPVILLPDDSDSWAVERRRDVLLHELAHIKRLDCPTQALARLVCALYWFNPLAWLAAHRLRVSAQRACDDMVLLAGSRASEYAMHLLDLARSVRSRHHHAFAALAMARPSHLEGA